jgi:hypothetical protein
MRDRVMRSAMAVAGLLCSVVFATGAQATNIDTYVDTIVAGGYTYIDPSTGSINGTIHFIGHEEGEGAAIGRILLVGKDAANNTQSIPVYCVDVSDRLGPGVFSTQSLTTLDFTAAQQAAIVTFITYGDAQVEAASGGERTLLAAAAQLGVWEILNETAADWDLGSGAFSVSYYDNNAIFDAVDQANDWLAALKNDDLAGNPTETLGVLNPGRDNQTQVYIIARGSSDIQPGVPEPATWGMIVVGFGLLGATLRLRQRKELFA